jgi:hypothetical protein
MSFSMYDLTIPLLYVAWIKQRVNGMSIEKMDYLGPFS